MAKSKGTQQAPVSQVASEPETPIVTPTTPTKKKEKSSWKYSTQIEALIASGGLKETDDTKAACDFVAEKYGTVTINALKERPESVTVVYNTGKTTGKVVIPKK